MFDVWKSSNGLPVTVDGNGTRDINVAIYCRVSTEHEEQISALQNQIDWYKAILPLHKRWRLVDSCFSAQSKKREKCNKSLQKIKGYYIDEGISGLSTNRPAFNKIISDAKKGKIDLIITREVCRFSRNTLDSLMVSRELRDEQYGVGIYFFNDNLFSYSNECELMLTIQSGLAQHESAKISERVRAGQRTSRQNGVLYGNGNILGYDLVHNDGPNHYVINAEQAETVKRIFELCYNGKGVSSIMDILVCERRKNSSGNVKWDYQNILRILHNKTYCGFVSYNVTKKSDYLDKKRRSVRNNEREFHKVSPDIVPPIISEEIWEACQKGLNSRIIKNFEPKKQNGSKSGAKDVFARLLRCKCGSSFNRSTSYKSPYTSKISYTYRCYNVKNHGKAHNYYDKSEMEALHICDMPSIDEKKLIIQASMVFKGIINDGSLIDDAIEIINKKRNAFKKDVDSLIAAKYTRIEELKQTQSGILRLCAIGKVSEEVFETENSSLEQEIQELNEDIKSLSLEKNNSSSIDMEMINVRKTLENMIDCSKCIDNIIIRKFVYQITVNSPTHFTWKLCFKSIPNEPKFIPIASYMLTPEYAAKFAKENGIRINASVWKDIKIDVEIAI